MKKAPEISTIAIIGDALQAWSAATILVRQLPVSIKLIVIEDDSASIVPSIVLDSDNRFHHLVGVSDLDLLAHCNGTLSLGTDLAGWSGPDSRFFSAPSGKLPAVNGVAFHHLVLRAAMARGEPEKLAEIISAFRFPARAAIAGKLTHGSTDLQSPRTMLRPNIHFDGESYAGLLKEKALAETDIEQHTGQVRSIISQTDSGDIKAIKITDNSEISADLYIDLSGGLVALMPNDRRPAVSDLLPIMPFDHMATSRLPTDRTVPFSRIEASIDSITFQHPLRNVTDQTLIGTAEHFDGSDSETVSLTNRRVEEFWIANIACAGSATCSFGTYLSADIRILQEQLMRLSELIPASGNMQVESAEYNRLNNILIDQIRDFYWLPFKLNTRPEPIWATLRDVSVPESLQIRLDQFRSRGRFVTFDGELFEEQEWIDLMIGFGHFPRRYDPMAGNLDMNQIAPSLGKMVDAFNQTINAMPTHAEYMARLFATTQNEASPEFPSL